MIRGSQMADFYVDETSLQINGKTCLLYGTVIPSRFEDATKHLFELKYRLGLNPSLEIRWRLQDVPPELKPQTKEGALEALARHFSCLVSITATEDKDIAFETVLDQIKLYASEHDILFANIYYDQDTFRAHSRVASTLMSWKSVRCTGLGRMDSRFSIGIQLADLLAGVFRYMIEIAFGQPKKRIHVYDGPLKQDVEYDLDEFFHIMLRYNFWGEYPPCRSEEITNIENITADSFNRGVVIRGEFAESELAVLRSLARFYRGCMH